MMEINTKYTEDIVRYSFNARMCRAFAKIIGVDFSFGRGKEGMRVVCVSCQTE